jgi:tRNA pseudouridine38-40 synthase
MLLAYDGAPFHGFAENAGVKTVGGTLRAAIEKVLGHPVALTCAGRTDTGVHAWGQVITFDAQDGVDLDGLQRSLNHMLGPTIAVRASELTDPGFDARNSARSRRYRYTVLNRAAPDPFLAPTSWHVEAPLDVATMQLACDPFLGEHDFAAFCRRPKTKAGTEASLTRRVLAASWEERGDRLLRFEIEATSFCHQMVRSIVGTMVEVGTGRKRAGHVRGIIASGDRHEAGDLAPARGLCLWAVQYDDGFGAP